MKYFIYLMDRDEYFEFSKSQMDICTYRARYRRAVREINSGDRLICYITRASEWAGILEVIDNRDLSSVKVTPVAWLDETKTISLFSDDVWSGLSFTRNLDRKSTTWKRTFYGVKFRQIENDDGVFLEKKIKDQLEQ